MWKNSNQKLFFLFIAAFLFAAFLFALNQISEADTGLLIKTGAYITEHYTVPLHDVFSYTAEGARWIAHYWLTALVFYGITVSGGTVGLIVLVALIATLTFGLLMRVVWIREKKIFLAFLLFPLFFGLTFGLWSARPQIFSYCFITLLILLIELFLNTKEKKYLYAVPFLMLAWANFHAGVILGLAVVFLFAFHEFASEMWRFGERTKRSAFVALTSLGVVFLNPNGYATLVYSQIIAPVAKALGVSEWFSLLDRLGTWESKVFLVFMVVVALALVFGFLKRYKEDHRLDFFHWGLAVVAVILPIVSVRHVIFFPLLTFPLFIGIAYRYVDSKEFPMEEIFQKRLIKPFFFILTLFIVAGGVNTAREFKTGSINTKLLPVHAADFIQKNGLNGPMFNLEEGGYFIWRLWPEQKVFLDGRNEVYAETPLNDYLSIIKQSSGWRDLVDKKYGINYFVMWYRPPIDAYANNIAVSVMNEEGFKLVYWDDTSIILVRDVPENTGIIKNYSYNIINPFRDPLNISPDLLPEALLEVRRARIVAPDSEALVRYETLLKRLAAMRGIKE